MAFDKKGTLVLNGISYSGSGSSGGGNTEVENARVGYDGTEYSDLKTRIDTEVAELNDADSRLSESIVNIRDFAEGFGNHSHIRLDYGYDSGYWSNSTTLTPSVANRNSVIKLPSNAKTIRYVVKKAIAVSSLRFGYILNEDKTKTLLALESTVGTHEYALPENSFWVLFNFFGKDYVDYFDISLYDVYKEIENRAILAENGECYFDYTSMKIINGYIDASGSIHQASSHAIVVTQVGGITKLRFNALKDLEQFPAVVVKDKNGNLLGVSGMIKSGQFEYNIPTSAEYDSLLYFNWFSFKGTQEYLNGVYAYVGNISNEIVYSSCVNKPFNFNGKSALFFGDSITVGHITGTQVTPNGYPKLFCDSVGMTFTNYAIAGSCFSYDYNGATSINHAIENVPLSELRNADYIFIAGGVNDWQTGCSEETLKSAINTLCTFLVDNNLSDKTIFITPINEGGRATTVPPKQNLQNVRNIITRRVLEANCSVIQGNEIPFPNAKDDSAYIDKMYGDKLHPSELGYRVYSKYLKTVLL